MRLIFLKCNIFLMPFKNWESYIKLYFVLRFPCFVGRERDAIRLKAGITGRAGAYPYSSKSNILYCIAYTIIPARVFTFILSIIFSRYQSMVLSLKPTKAAICLLEYSWQI